MVLFPPEFPFVKRQAQAQSEQKAAIIEAIAPAKPAPAAPPEPQETRPQPPPVASAPFVERRKLKRDLLATHAMIRMDALHSPLMKINLIDITVAGVGFRAAFPLSVGTKGQVRLEVGPLRWTTRLRVIHCSRERDGNHRIGCAFLRTELLRPWPEESPGHG